MQTRKYVSNSRIVSGWILLESNKTGSGGPWKEYE